MTAIAEIVETQDAVKTVEDARPGLALRHRDRPSAPATARQTAAPVTGWRRLAGDWILVSGATLSCQVVAAATSLVLRMLLSPAQMGIWQGAKLFLGYANYSNLGISKGAVREFTVALGKGETTDARRGLDLAFTVNTVTSLVYGGVLVAAGAWIGLSGGAWARSWALGLALVGALAVLGRYVTFHVTILRAKQAFATTSALSLVEGGATLILCGLATWRFGLVGLYGGTLAAMLVSLVFVRRRRAVTLRWAWDGPRARRLIGIGGPILLAGTVSTLFRSLDKLMILGYLDDCEVQLGWYSVTLMVTAQLYGLGNMLSVVMAPRYAEKYGRTGDRRDAARLAARATELHAATLALPAALAIVLGQPLLGRLLPDYRTGLAPLVWLVPGVVLLVASLPASQYLVAVDRQRRALATVVVATGLAALGNHLALAGGYGLRGVALATALSYAAYFALTAAVSLWIELDRAERLRYLGMLALAMGPTIGLAVLLEYQQPNAEIGWTVAASRAVAIFVVWMATVAVGWHGAGWREAFRRCDANPGGFEADPAAPATRLP